MAGSALARPETGMPVGAEKMEHHYSHAKAYKKHVALTAAANECTAKGEICISHCLETFMAGDTTMAECANAVQQMLPVCAAMAQLSTYDSAHLPALAKACIGVCEDCEKECRVHEEHQPECRDCADACAALIKEAKTVVA
jgi:Cys-rich four helix bundle protein (predicted Tat secretion target)